MGTARKRSRKNAEDDKRKARLTAEGHSRGVIPGIPYDITIEQICTRVPWATLHELCKVNFAWQDVIRSREIHDARVRSGSTEKLIVFNHCLPGRTFGIAVLSLQTGFVVQLPPIPRIKKGIPDSCQCVTLDGRVYILGGLKKPRAQVASEEVYMLDLVEQAGHGPWKKCASMQAPRCNFGSGIINGKIYVCGGSASRAPVHETEVYDPSANTWTTIKPMPSARCRHQVHVIEHCLVIVGGRFFLPNFLELQTARGRRTLSEFSYTEKAPTVGFYNAEQDEWGSTREDPEGEDIWSHVRNSFMIGDVLHDICRTHISAYDPRDDSWGRVRSVSQSMDGLRGYRRLSRPLAILVVDDELVVIEPFSLDVGTSLEMSRTPPDIVLNRSTGLQIEGKQLTWTRIECALQLHDTFTFLRSIQL